MPLTRTNQALRRRAAHQYLYLRPHIKNEVPRGTLISLHSVSGKKLACATNPRKA